MASVSNNQYSRDFYEDISVYKIRFLMIDYIYIV